MKVNANVIKSNSILGQEITKDTSNKLKKLFSEVKGESVNGMLLMLYKAQSIIEKDPEYQKTLYLAEEELNEFYEAFRTTPIDYLSNILGNMQPDFNYSDCFNKTEDNIVSRVYTFSNGISFTLPKENNGKSFGSVNLKKGLCSVRIPIDEMFREKILIALNLDEIKSKEYKENQEVNFEELLNDEMER